jgi:hypothetical protein
MTFKDELRRRDQATKAAHDRRMAKNRASQQRRLLMVAIGLCAVAGGAFYLHGRSQECAARGEVLVRAWHGMGWNCVKGRD